MRGVFMEKAMRKIKNPRLLIIVGIVVIAALAVGIYFMVVDKEKEPTRGTYVISQYEKGNKL